MGGLVARARGAARRAARTAALSGAAALFGLVGLGFLTAGVFLFLAALKGAVFAAMILGLFYLGFAAIFAAFAFLRREPEPEPAPPIPLVEAFLIGISAGRNFRAGRGR